MILVISICKEKLHELEFVRPIEDILTKNKIKFQVKHYSKLNKQDISKADKIIICGTSLADNKFLEDVKKFAWLKSYLKPVLGICGGSHIIGITLGYKIKKSEAVGFKTINFKKEFLGIKGKREVYSLHQYQVIPEVFQEKNFYATLFHPEVRNKNMIVNFLKKI